MIRTIYILFLTIVLSACEKNLPEDKTIDVMSLTHIERVEMAKKVIETQIKKSYPTHYISQERTELEQNKSAINNYDYWTIHHEFTVKRKNSDIIYYMLGDYSLDKQLTIITSFTEKLLESH